MTAATTGAAPTILPLLVANLPLDDLRPYPHAVTWALAWRAGKNGNPGAWTKVPKNPRTGHNAKSNNPATWADVAYVLAHFDRFGFVVWTADPFTFLDLDKAINPLTGTIKPWAQRIVDRLLGAYWERSTTGAGLKGLIRGQPPRNRIAKVGDGQVEIFFSGKFTALTGHRLEGGAATIGEGQAALDALYHEVCGPTRAPERTRVSVGPLHFQDEDVVARARAAGNGAKFARLFDQGDTSEYDHDHSRADQALVSLLRFWTESPEQLDRIFRSSALCRSKWEDRPDYRQRTIAKALAGGETYQPPATILCHGLRARTARLRVREVSHA
jgi:primase-polymerase (primpol)-like protein